MRAAHRHYADCPAYRRPLSEFQYDVTRRRYPNDVTTRLVRSEQDWLRRPRRERARFYTPRTATSDGLDDDYRHDYHDRHHDYWRRLAPARVQLYTHDSRDPHSCTCYPQASSRTIPSMMYDGVRCPHPEHLYQPARQDYFAYPWSVQTYRPHRRPDYGYLPGQAKPPSAVTAPPFALYTKHGPRGLGGKAGGGPPPYSAPVKPVLAPLLSARPSDRRLRRADRQRLQAPALESVQEEDVSPFDSVSQAGQAPRPWRSFRADSLRLRTVDDRVVKDVDSDLRLASRHRALSTPRPRAAYDSDGFPQTPTRIFKGEYIDPNSGHKYEYNIKYGKLALGGTRRIKTV